MKPVLADDADPAERIAANCPFAIFFNEREGVWVCTRSVSVRYCTVDESMAAKRNLGTATGRIVGRSAAVARAVATAKTKKGTAAVRAALSEVSVLYGSKNVCQAAVTKARRAARGDPLDIKELLVFVKKFDAFDDNRGVWETVGDPPSLNRVALFSGVAKRLAVAGALQPIVSMDATFMTLRWTARTIGDALLGRLRGGEPLRPNATVDVQMGGLFVLVGRTHFNSTVLLGVAWVSGETEANLIWCLQQYKSHFGDTVVCPTAPPVDAGADVQKSMLVFVDYGQAVRNALKKELPFAHVAHCVVHFRVCPICRFELLFFSVTTVSPPQTPHLQRNIYATQTTALRSVSQHTRHLCVQEFMKAASAATEPEFKQHMENMSRIPGSKPVVDYINRRPVETWAVVYIRKMGVPVYTKFSVSNDAGKHVNTSVCGYLSSPHLPSPQSRTLVR